jgi:hypothetical protein
MQISNGEFRWIAAAGIGDIVIWVIGIVSTLNFFSGWDLDSTILGCSMAAASLWTLVLFYRIGDLRTAVTVAFIVLYLGFVIASMVPGAASSLEAENSFARVVWDNLSALMIAIIGFYFGGKALEVASGNVANKLQKRGGASKLGDVASEKTDQGNLE